MVCCSSFNEQGVDKEPFRSGQTNTRLLYMDQLGNEQKVGVSEQLLASEEVAMTILYKDGHTLTHPANNMVGLLKNSQLQYGCKSLKILIVFNST